MYHDTSRRNCCVDAAPNADVAVIVMMCDVFERLQHSVIDVIDVCKQTQIVALHLVIFVHQYSFHSTPHYLVSIQLSHDLDRLQHVLRAKVVERLDIPKI